MTGRLKFLFLYYLAWILFFELARLVFILYNLPEARHINFITNAQTFWFGLRMDVSMAAYLLLPICLFVIAGIYIPFFRKAFLYKVYTYILLFFILIIIISDLEVYKSWGFRIDATPLKYLASPNEAWASISHLPLLLLLFVFIILYVGLCMVWRIIIDRKTHLLKSQVPKLVTTLVLLVFTAFLVIPIRGGLQLTPMNQSIVYFSKENFANITAINATWNFMYGLSKNRDTKNPYRYLDEKKAARLVDSLYQNSDSTIRVLKTEKPNVILVIWESFTEKATHTMVGGLEVTPRFNKLKKEGIYFSHLYASGDRTDKGLAAVLSGYPALNNFSVIHQPAKSAKLPALGHYFKKMGYRNLFYYGGEPEFANIKSYLLQSQYEQLVGKKDFSSREQNSKWGAHDGAVAGKITRDLNNMQSPFFATWLTLTSHEPFESPVAPVFDGDDVTTRFLNSLHYTDDVLFKLVQQWQQQPWWDNTLLVIIADHGHPLPEPSNRLDNFKIPMLWLGGALSQKGITIEKIGSQLDVAATLTGQIKKESNYFPFSKDLFNSSTRPWAYFSFNNGFGLVQPGKSFVFDNVGMQVVSRQGIITESDIETGKSLQQFFYQDYLNR